MKAFGWVLIVLGALSFLGAASKGHDVFGPCFCIGVGGLIVYLKRFKIRPKQCRMADGFQHGCLYQYFYVHHRKGWNGKDHFY